MATHGLFAVYKPKGPTSYDIIREIQKISGVRKVGHAGTLDPLAKGVLVIGIGREFTKKLGEIVGKEKEYLATVKLGWESSTDDAEGGKKIINSSLKPSIKEIKKTAADFQGKIFQVPPIFSAIKIRGKRAYKLARQNQRPLLKPRKVEIKKIEILKYYWPYISLRVITGPGVYIRALARDMGRKLKTGGYLAKLERVRVGKFSKEEAITMDNLKRYLEEKAGRKNINLC